MSGASEIDLDFARPERIGLEEAIYCAGKSVAQIDAILEQARARDASLLLTRLDADKLAALAPTWAGGIDYCAASRTGFFGPLRPAEGPAQVAVVCAGTSDTRVAREAERVLRYQGRPSSLYLDVGVAGLHRLISRLEAIRAHPVVIVCAGMDAALPSVLGGLIASPVIAVPTSVGYGVAEGGRTALNSMLASCAPGIAVVNIDNGYGAACAALRILHAAEKMSPAR